MGDLTDKHLPNKTSQMIPETGIVTMMTVTATGMIEETIKMHHLALLKWTLPTVIFF